MFADANLGAGLELYVGRARQMIGMGVRLQHPIDGQSLCGRGGEDHVGGFGRSLAARVVIIEHGIDDGAPLRIRVGDEIAHRVGGLVEKGADQRFLCHGLFFHNGHTSLSIDIYISCL